MEELKPANEKKISNRQQQIDNFALKLRTLYLRKIEAAIGNIQNNKNYNPEQKDLAIEEATDRVYEEFKELYVRAIKEQDNLRGVNVLREIMLSLDKIELERKQNQLLSHLITDENIGLSFKDLKGFSIESIKVFLNTRRKDTITKDDFIMLVDAVIETDNSSAIVDFRKEYNEPILKYKVNDKLYKKIIELGNIDAVKDNLTYVIKHFFDKCLYGEELKIPEINDLSGKLIKSNSIEYLSQALCGIEKIYQYYIHKGYSLRSLPEIRKQIYDTIIKSEEYSAGVAHFNLAKENIGKINDLADAVVKTKNIEAIVSFLYLQNCPFDKIIKGIKDLKEEKRAVELIVKNTRHFRLPLKSEEIIQFVLTQLANEGNYNDLIFFIKKFEENESLIEKFIRELNQDVLENLKQEIDNKFKNKKDDTIQKLYKEINYRLQRFSAPLMKELNTLYN